MAALQTDPPGPPKGPLEATVVTLEPSDVLPDALLEQGLPRHELKASPVVDHGEAHILEFVEWALQDLRANNATTSV